MSVDIYQPNQLIDNFIAEIVVETSVVDAFGSEDDLTVCCIGSFSQAEGADGFFIEKIYKDHDNTRAFEIERDSEHMEQLRLDCIGELAEYLKNEEGERFKSEFSAQW